MTAYVRFIARTIWLAVLPGVLLSGSELPHGPACGSLVNDESAANNRRAASLAGFRAMLLTAAIRYGVTASMPLDVRPPIQVIVALMHVGSLERRAVKA